MDEQMACVKQENSDTGLTSEFVNNADWSSNIQVIYEDNSFQTGSVWSEHYESTNIKLENENDVTEVEQEESKIKFEYSKISDPLKAEVQTDEKHTDFMLTKHVGEFVDVKSDNVFQEEEDGNNVEIVFNEISDYSEEEEEKERSSDSSDKKHKCLYCPYRASMSHHLKLHLRTHTGERPYECHDCDYKGKGKQHLKSHIMFKHLKQKPFECKLCPYRAVTASRLARHVKTHQWQKSCKCNFCGHEADSASALKNHKYDQHWDKINDESIREKTYKCPQCEYQTDFPYILKSHIHSHSDERPFTCDMCSYSAKKKTSLKEHVVSKHGSEKPFKCNLCPYSSALLKYLKRHMEAHQRHNQQQLKPSVCEVCNKKFSNKQCYQEHMLKHSDGDMPFKCDVCNYATLYKFSLSMHKRNMHLESK